MRTVPSGQEVARERATLAHVHELEAAAAEVEHGAVAQRGRVHGGEVAEIGLLGGAQQAHLQAGRRAHALEQLLAVFGVADALVATACTSSRAIPLAVQKCA